jgi:hypothetical protein
VTVWKTDSDELLYTVEGEAAELAAIAPNGCCLLTVRKDGTARIWRIPGGELPGTFAGNTGELYSAELHSVSFFGLILAFERGTYWTVTVTVGLGPVVPQELLTL